jgi:hypothetical protein
MSNELYWTEEVLDALAARVTERVISRLAEAIQPMTGSGVSLLEPVANGEEGP